MRWLALLCGFMVASAPRPAPLNSPHLRTHSIWYAEALWALALRPTGLVTEPHDLGAGRPADIVDLRVWATPGTLDAIDHDPELQQNEACPVANIKSQIKRNRQNDAAHERNKAVKSALKTAVRKFREAADAGDADQARRPPRRRPALDKAASKGVIHKNQAANRKSAIDKQAASL